MVGQEALRCSITTKEQRDAGGGMEIVSPAGMRPLVPGEVLGADPAPVQDAACKESPDQSTPTWGTLGAAGGQGPHASLLQAHDGHSPFLKPCCQL